MTPRFDEPIRPGIKYKTRPGAYAIIRQGDQALVTFQAKPRAEFQLPGGGIDPGETPITALHREVREETGWSIRIEHKLGTFRRFTYMPDYDLWARKVCHIYLCAPVRRKVDIKEPHHTAHWMPLQQAAELLANGGDRHFVEQVIRRAALGRARIRSGTATAPRSR